MSIEKKKITIADIAELKKSFHSQGLNTVCQSAKCPNIGECFKKRTATFLILGKHCTRACNFCAIGKNKPETVDPREPEKVAAAIKDMGLSYSVITSVTRDDLPDGGAQHFAQTVEAVRAAVPESKIEVLVPDFQGDKASVDTVLAARPDVFSHNIETVPNLYSKVRGGADYLRSLGILKYAAEKGFKTKTGIMLGLGETADEIREAVNEVKKNDISVFTVGQYLAPTKKHHPVMKEYSEAEFKSIEEYALGKGIKRVVSGRYVRSSYLAEESFIL